ncbi:MAG TPA: class I SAM-dependent methyltransferase [Pseudolabrys sp.]|nr:class I SAM-dependent methyltransferase [Pseudolabrys sp.]
MTVVDAEMPQRNARGTAVGNAYTAQFFNDQRDGSLASASIILPLLIDVFQPRSLIDIGCGQGTWSKTAMDLGIEDQVGVDGAWAQPVLQIPRETFRPCDLAAPFDLGRHFDLAISMEVGEHISPAQADVFVGNIVRHSDAVVFSAAAPYQGGVHHVNEQWPAYWAQKFAERDYRCFDFLRWRVWDDRRIATWYRQNLLVFANRRNAALIHRLEVQAAETPPAAIAVIHPDMWVNMMNSKSLRLQRLMAPLLRGTRALVPKAKPSQDGQLPGRL